MSRSLKKAVTALIVTLIFAVIIGAFLLFGGQKKTILNDNVNANGNTPGNLYNGGLFAESDGNIYFSNPLDYGFLYVMDETETTAKKLLEKPVFSINAYGAYIYFSTNNAATGSSSASIYRSSPGVYRSDLTGDNLLELHGSYSQTISLIGNNLIFQDLENDRAAQTTTWSVKSTGIDEKAPKDLIDKPINISCTVGSTIYYSGVEEDHNLYKLNTRTRQSVTLLEGNCWMPIVYHSRELYYIDLANNYALVKTTVGKPEEGQILVNERISSYNVSDTYIYFQIDDQENSKFCRIRKDAGMNEYEVIKEGNFHNINITPKYVYFQAFNNPQKTYRTSLNGQVRVQSLSTVLKPKTENKGDNSASTP